MPLPTSSASIPARARSETAGSPGAGHPRVRGAAVAPLGSGTLQGAASLGVPASGAPSALSGGRMLVGSAEGGGYLATRNAQCCTSCSRADAEKLLNDARELRRAASAAAEDLQMARAHRAEAKAKYLEELASRVTFEAREEGDAIARWRDRARESETRADAIAERVHALDPDGVLPGTRREGDTARG